MKKLFSLFLFSCVISATNAQEVLAPTAGKPQATTKNDNDDVLSLKETEFDFGKIPQGKPVTHIFTVINNGKDSLKIENIQASCGCTTPEWEREKVQPPAGKTAITIGYNAANEGPFTKLITITYNGVMSKQITIKGDVWKTPVSSAPENKELADLKD